ncbi:T9SS type A sorting domain-containing protein [Chitinophagaceae bacterium 26-R-25]|nr:T9SS type A sorting domain-containing protein [Chitinophagaceae bacterium 26-R-25]
MKRFLLAVLGILICSLGYSQVIGYSYTIKLGSSNNQLNVYAIPNGSGSVKWQQMNVVVGFKTSAAQPGQGTFAPNNGLFGTYSVVTPSTGTGNGYTYTNWGTNLGWPSNWISVTNGTEYLIGTITYPAPLTSYVPYLLDLADGGSNFFGNTFIVEGATNDYFYATDGTGNSKFYSASGGGYQNSGSLVIDNSADVWSATPKITVLPLKLLAFNAKQSNSTGLLDWKVTEQQNTASFIVERSTDGEHYTAIGTIAAAGNYVDAKTYSFTDKSPANGLNYYRLKMVDIDGKYSYSPVKTLRFDAIAGELHILPNPVVNNFYVKGLLEPALVRVLDVNGKVVLVQNDVTATTIVNAASLARAVYLVQVIQGNESKGVLKLIKE